MKVDPTQCAKRDNYLLLTNLIMPRPIAWVTTLDATGVVNLAPFSFFNAVSSDPLQLMISVERRAQDSPKDTARNIEQSGEFVVSMITEELMPAMNISGADFPPNVSELDAAGLHAAASEKVKAPRVAESPVSFECVLRHRLPLGSNTLFVGEVVMFHVADQLIDAHRRIAGFAPVGRMGSPSAYCRTIDCFDLPRLSREQAFIKPPVR